MDVHENLGDVTEEDIKGAHQRDLEIHRLVECTADRVSP